MKIINYISNLAIPFTILLTVSVGLIERKSVFDIFLKGAREGLEIVINIFPTLVGLFVAISALRYSGVLDFIIKLIEPVINLLHIPLEIMPLAILRPISGSGSIAIATNIMKTFGVDSLIGKIASTIMGSTETTLYTIAIYTSYIKVKKTRFILIAALFADIIGISVSIIICRFLS